jgi:hypothetical protein
VDNLTGHSHRKKITGNRIKQIFTFIGVGICLLTIILVNLTPGHFGYPDIDGCACFISYTIHPSKLACEVTRPLHCDQSWLDRLIIYISYLDFNK